MRSLIVRRILGAARGPASSRAAYRVQRLWLTPLFRRSVRIGIPAFALAMVLGGTMADPANRQALRDGVQRIRSGIEDRPEFRLTDLAIAGASPAVAEDVRAALALDLPLSSLVVDLEGLRRRVEALPAVARADIRVRAGGHLSVAVTERVPVIVWNAREGAVAIDAGGHVVAPLSQRPPAASLPMMAGDGADRAVPEALALIAAARPLGDRLRGVARMGERRWDVVLADGRRILLPAEAPVAALDRALALHDAADLLNRGVLRVDLRNPDRLTVRMAPGALEDYRRLRALDAHIRTEGQGG